MLPIMRRRFDELERIRLNVLAELDPLSPRQLSTRPGEGKWCLEEVVEHLVMAEREVLLQPLHPLSNPTGKPGMRSQLMFGVVLLVLQLNIPVPVPSAEMLPNGRKSLPALIQEWENQRACLARFLTHVTVETMHWQVFFHPIAGMIDVPQALRLAKFHMLHHVHQVTEIITRVGSDRNAVG